MAHPENLENPEQEPEYWTPEAEAANDPDARLNKILDKAEKGLDALGREAARPAPPDPFALPVPPRAQIEVRLISNGFIMSFSRAVLVAKSLYPFPVYLPVAEEMFIAGPSSAGAALADAMESATLLKECLKKMEEYHDQPPAARGAPPTT